MIRVLVVHRDRATRESLAAGLGAAQDIEVVEQVAETAQALKALDRPGARVDIVVAPVGARGDGSLGLAETLRERPDRPGLILTQLTESDALLCRYLEAGMDAWLTEDHSLSGLLLVLRLLSRGEVLVGPSTAHLLIRRLQSLAALLAPSGIDLSSVSTLTRREREILGLIAQELTNQEIAKRLYIGVGTVKSHVHSILKKLDVRDRTDARKVYLLWSAETGATD